MKFPNPDVAYIDPVMAFVWKTVKINMENASIWIWS